MNFKPDPPTVDFEKSPFIVIWEMTRSCALRCVHCRAEAINERNPGELTTEQAFLLLDEIRRFGTPPPVSSRHLTGQIALQSQETGGGGKPLVVFTGGDPLRRPDAKEIVDYGTRIGLRVAMTPSGTAEVTLKDLEELRANGLARLAVSLDGSTPFLHDGFRGVQGSFGWTMNIIRQADKIGLPVQINTTISKHNIEDLDELCFLMEDLRIVLWSVFFLVPVGRGKLEDEIGGYEYERVFNRMAHLSNRVSFDIKSTEAPHYRRVLVQKMVKKRPSDVDRAPMGATPPPACDDRLRDRPMYMGQAGGGVNDGKGFVFVSHTGEIYPSGFLPISAGNVKKDSLVDVYRNSNLFKTLRDYSKLKGKCGVCEYKAICGGSRARAFAVCGDMMAPEPFCVHVPKGYKISKEEMEFWKPKKEEMPIG